MEKTYKVVRFHYDQDHPDHRKVIATGLTLDEAQAHCQDPTTRGVDAGGEVEWFDGYNEEG